MRVADVPEVQAVREAVAAASRAPSIHNTQPWSWSFHGATLDLYADRTRRLAVADPTGRSLMLSCGAALHHLCVVMGASGWQPRPLRLPDPHQPTLLASVHFRRTPEGETPDPRLVALADAVEKRSSDRRAVSSWPVPPQLLDGLVAAAADQGGLLTSLSEDVDASVWTEVARRVASRVDEQAGYRHELEEWMPADPDAVEGVPAANLPGAEAAAASFDRGTARFPEGELAPPAAEPQPPSGVTLLLSTTSDDPMSRLRAGEALSAILLEASRVGLATQIDSQPVEVEVARTLIEERALGGTRSPQVIIHVGWPASSEPVPPTPRRPVDEILTIED